VHEGGGCRAFAGGDAADFPPALVVAHGEPDGGRFGSALVQPGRRQAPIRQAGEARALRGCARGRRQVGDRQGDDGRRCQFGCWRGGLAPGSGSEADAEQRQRQPCRQTCGQTYEALRHLAVGHPGEKKAAWCGLFGVFQAVQRTIWFSSPLA
jgi:hypothetical protein